MSLMLVAYGAILWAIQDQKPPPPNPPQDLTEMSLEDLMKLEVTSVAKREQPLIEAPAAITVIRGDDIRRTGVTSVAEALRMVPGVFVGHLDSNKWAIGVRGFGDLFSNKLLVLIDGRSVYNPLFSGVYWDVQDTLLEDIDRIEVIRGPGSTLWGANAVNGVINVTTKKAQDTSGGLLTVLGGDQEHLIAGARYGGKVGDDVYYRAYVKYENHAPFTGGNDAWEISRAGFRTDWTPSRDTTLTVQGDIYDGEEHNLFTLPTLNPPFTSQFQAPTFVHGGNLLARFDHNFGSDVQLQAQAYWDRTGRLFVPLDETRDTLDLDLQLRFPIFWGQKLAVGAGYRWTADQTSGSFFSTLDPADKRAEVASTFIQDEIPLVENVLTLTIGSKFEYNNYTHFEDEPGVRLSWHPADRHTVWASASRAVRTPSEFEEDVIANTQVLPPNPPASPLPTDIRFMGDHAFKSEVLRAYELGYRTRPVDSLILDATVFFNDYYRLRTSEQGNPSPEGGPPPTDVVVPLTAANLMEGHSYGAELAATWQVQETVRLYGAYTFLRMHLHTIQDSTNASSAVILEHSSPSNIVSLRGSWDPVKDVTFDLMGRYVDAISAWNVRHYIEMDARLGWMVTRNLEAALVGQNLLHASHFETTNSQIGNPATQTERGVYVSLTWRF